MTLAAGAALDAHAVVGRLFEQLIISDYTARGTGDVAQEHERVFAGDLVPQRFDGFNGKVALAHGARSFPTRRAIGGRRSPPSSLMKSAGSEAYFSSR